MDNMISIRSNRTERWTLNIVFLKAIRQTPSDVEIDTKIPLKTPILAKCGMISHQVSIKLQEDYEKGTGPTHHKLLSFLQGLHQHVSMPRFLESICLLGLSDLKDSIRILLSPERLGQAEYQYSQLLRDVYYEYKSQWDQKPIEFSTTNPRNLINTFRDEIIVTLEYRERNKLVIQLIVALWLLTQQVVNPLVIDTLVDAFEHLLPELNVDRTLPDIFICTKRAISAAHKLNQQMALGLDQQEEYRVSQQASADLLSQANNMSYLYNDTTINYMINHSRMFLGRLKLLRYDNEENKEQVLDLGKDSVNMIIDDKLDEFGTYGYRSFCLYGVFIHLSIGPYFEMDLTGVVSESDIVFAEGLIRRVKESFKSGQRVESRRKMKFYVSKARLYQLKRDIPQALENVIRAQQIRHQCFQYQEETENLRIFRESLQSETLPQPNLLPPQ